MAYTPDIPGMQDYPARACAHERPRVSVITTVRNAEKTLACTIESVRAQILPSLEYIVVDANSTDRTMEIVKSYPDTVTFWQSEKDGGISDGFNKGIALSTGEYVTLLNADDWLSPGQITTGINALERSGADFVFGDLEYHAADGSTHLVRGDAAYADSITRVMPALNHPTVIVRRAVYERLGLFDRNLRYAMDYELLLRFHLAGCRGIYEPRIIGHMSLDGASDSNNMASLREVYEISVRHGYPALLALWLYRFRIVKSFIRRATEQILPHEGSLAIRHMFNRSVTSAK